MSEEQVKEEVVEKAVEETADQATAVEAVKEQPETAETMEDYSEELEASFKKIEAGDVLKGTVIGVTESQVSVDLKYYAEGVIRLEDYSSDPDFNLKENVQVGEEISATVIRTDDGQGNILLSRKEANEALAWDKLEQMMEEETIIPVKVKGVVNAGVIAYVEGVRGFIPASKLAIGYVEDLDEYLLKDIEVRIITAEREKKRLVLSAREILRERAAEERKQKISNVEIGLVTEGVVESLQTYGAFVNIGDGMSGLVHISQISHKHIKHPKVVMSEGDKVKVKVIGVKDGKISLSMKALEDVAAEEVKEEAYDLPQSESISTNLGELFKNIKL